MKITKERLKEIIKDVLREETEYQKFFKKALEKSGKSIPQMSDDEKKTFFNKHFSTNVKAMKIAFQEDLENLQKLMIFPKMGSSPSFSRAKKLIETTFLWFFTCVSIFFTTF